DRDGAHRTGVSCQSSEDRDRSSYAGQTILARHHKWTQEEDERLKAFVAQGASIVRSAAALNRKIVSVRTRARALGCPFPPLKVFRKSAPTDQATPDRPARR